MVKNNYFHCIKISFYVIFISIILLNIFLVSDSFAQRSDYSRAGDAAVRGAISAVGIILFIVIIKIIAWLFGLGSQTVDKISTSIKNSNMIKTRCPNCNKIYTVRKSDIGKETIYTGYNNLFLIKEFILLK